MRTIAPPASFRFCFTHLFLHACNSPCVALYLSIQNSTDCQGAYEWLSQGQTRVPVHPTQPTAQASVMSRSSDRTIQASQDPVTGGWFDCNYGGGGAELVA
ncbi:hypothetical protein K504DRAFT_61364 [Pleomassaria siparia CBS 279.74]|uniref:Secreted protein n=1 Tax=Pleomassaria siparia CBS 279.74 TaxID=1314801 RepID=A0A6G1K208_9PLEO|nr:hypothetical protein K504DRAFT_61364 [Pleomassaria siparia CBS 279.74]